MWGTELFRRGTCKLWGPTGDTQALVGTYQYCSTCYLWHMFPIQFSCSSEHALLQIWHQDFTSNTQNMRSKQLTTTYEKFKWSAHYFIIIFGKGKVGFPGQHLAMRWCLSIPGISCLMPFALSKFCNMLSKGQHVDNIFLICMSQNRSLP